MMGILKDLYYGNLSGCDERMSENSELAEAVNTTAQAQINFVKTLTGEQKELFERLSKARDRQTDIECRSAFDKGFRIGSGLMIETLVDIQTSPES